MALSIKVLDVKPLDNIKLLVTFENQIEKVYDVTQLFELFPEFKQLTDRDFFNTVRVDCGGYAVCWNDEIDISEVELWDNGIEVKNHC